MFSSTIPLFLESDAIPILILGCLDVSLSKLESQATFPSFSDGLEELVDFDAPRLVRFFADTIAESECVYGIGESIWMTEREKLNATSNGRGYTDMFVSPRLSSGLL